MARQDEPQVTNRSAAGFGPIPIRFRPERTELAPSEERPTAPSKGEGAPDTRELKGVYIISVAARILAMHPQTLRKYERLGLISPSRTVGMLRLYSEEDIQKLRLIRHLQDNLGINLAGVEFVIDVLNHLMEMLSNMSTMPEGTHQFSVMEREVVRFLRRLNLPSEI